jgi:hypothetical protein
VICKPCTNGEHAYCEYPPDQKEIEKAADEMLVTGFHQPYRGKGCTCEHRLAHGTVETGTTKFDSEVKAGVEPSTGPSGE